MVYRILRLKENTGYLITVSGPDPDLSLEVLNTGPCRRSESCEAALKQLNRTGYIKISLWAGYRKVIA